MTNQEMTREEYKTEILKRNFAARIAEYEDAIATLQTQLQVVVQKLRQYEADEQQTELPLDDATVEPVASSPPPPPAPPAE